ncbi:MAG: putative lipid II flippase FtsW [Pseudobdellovibrionaceae bacterium]
MNKLFTDSPQRLFVSNLLLVVFALYGIGLVQVYSSSYIFAVDTYNDGLFFFKRQLLFTFVSICCLFFVAYLPSHWIRKWGWTLWCAALGLLILTFVPGIGVHVGGAARWIQLPLGLRFEPSELLKVAFPLFFATLFIRSETFLSRAHYSVLLFALIFPFVMLYKQPDFGSFAILIATGFMLLFCFGLRIRAIVTMALAGLPLFIYLMMAQSYRRARLMAFLDPWADAERKGFQVIQSMLSFHSGGLFGKGIGQSQGKLFFLPEAHTDFTLAIFGEEFGLLGFLVLLSLFGFIVYRTLQIVHSYDDRFVRALLIGLMTVFVFSFFINCGVVMGLLPTKGLTLPFLSYGGSSLVCMGLMFGLILNIELNSKQSFDSVSR